LTTTEIWISILGFIAIEAVTFYLTGGF